MRFTDGDMGVTDSGGWTFNSVEDEWAYVSKQGYHLKSMTLIDQSQGVAHLRLSVTEDVANALGVLHGGAAATIVDEAGTIAILSIDPNKRGLSAELNVSWFHPIRLGDAVVIEARALKVGKTLATAVVDLRRESDGTLAAHGRVTKSV